MRPILLLHSSNIEHDRVGKAVQSLGVSGRLRVRSVKLDELVSVMRYRYAWALYEPELVLQEHFGVNCQYLLLNRLVEDVRCLFECMGDFRLLAALDRWINSFPLRTCSSGLYSMAGSRLPLNLQWLQVGSRIKDVTVPSFEYALSSEGVDAGRFREPLDKDPYDGFVWDRSTESDQRQCRFVVERPTGIPHLCSFAGSRSLVVRIRDGRLVGGELGARLGSFGIEIGRELGHALGQVLFFVAGTSVTFASFMADHYGMKSVQEYPSWLLTSLQGWTDASLKRSGSIQSPWRITDLLG